jgi:hypothetical protein
MEGFQMITVSPEQLNTVEYLIEQSSQGNHVLFDLEMVRRVFENPPKPMTEQEAAEIEGHIEKLISLEGYERQKAYLSKLPETALLRVIKIYFNIVENNLFENSRVRH